MLSNKNQKYIFERLLKGLSVAYQPLDEDRFVFTDGVRLFIFSKLIIIVNVNKLTKNLFVFIMSSPFKFIVG